MENVIVLTSVTYAASAKELLKKAGIRSEITRNAQVRKVRGCGYGLIIDKNNIPSARKILAENGIKILN